MRAMTILDILEDTASRLPEKTAVLEEGRQLRYGELLSRAQTVGYALSETIRRGGYTF